MIPDNLKSRSLNVVNWNFNTEADILALGQEKRFLNVVYTSGKVRYKAVEETNGTLSLVKDTDGAVTKVLSGDGTKTTIVGSETKVELDLSVSTSQAAQIEEGKLIVKKLAMDADSANLAEFVDVVGGGQKLVIKRSGRRGKYVRTAQPTIEEYMTSSEYVLDANATDPALKFALIPGDTLMFVNSADPANVGYNQMKFSYENIGNANNINDFIEKEKDASETPYTSNSTVVTLNPTTREINHNFSTAHYNALKVNATSGAGEVIVRTSLVERTNPDTGVKSDMTVESYLNMLDEGHMNQNLALSRLDGKIALLETDVTGLKSRTYTQGAILDGTQVKLGGTVSETRTTTMQANGILSYNSNVQGVGAMFAIKEDKVEVGNNFVFVVGKGYNWYDPTTNKYFHVDFHVPTGAESLSAFNANGAQTPPVLSLPNA